MKLKMLAILGLFATVATSQAANVSIDDVAIAPGTPTVQVPLLITPDGPGELISGMNISFAAGSVGDAIPIIDADPLNPSVGTPEEFSGTIWEPGYFASSGTPSFHSVLSAVSRVAPPLQVSPNGTIAVYTLDTSALPTGSYTLNPNFVDPVSGVGSSAFTVDAQGGIVPVALTFDPGVLTIEPPVTNLQNAHLFYNDSTFDGNGVGVDASDFAAIASDKSPLRFGETGSFSNISGYSRGINGIFLDFDDLPDNGAALGLIDFTFTTGNDNFPSSWTAAPPATDFGVLVDQGEDGADRVYVTFADGDIRDTWLRVSVEGNSNTGLATDEDFFFGSVPGDTRAAFVGQGTFFGRDAADLQSIALNIFNAAGKDDLNDLNKSGFIDAFDLQVIPVASGGGIESNVLSAITPTQAAVGQAAVPEPATWLLGLLAAIFWAAVRTAH